MTTLKQSGHIAAVPQERGDFVYAPVAPDKDGETRLLRGQHVAPTVTPRALSLAVALDDFLDYCSVELNLSSHTLAAYRPALARWFKLLRIKTVTDLEALPVETIIHAMHHRQRQGISASTEYANICALRSFCRFLINDGIIRIDPTDRLQTRTPPRKLPVLLTPDEITRLMAAPLGDKGHTRHEPTSYRNAAMLELLFASGIRVSELCGLNVGSLDLEAHSGIVFGKGRKERIILFGQRAADAVKAYMELERPKYAGKSEALFVQIRGARLNRQEAHYAIRHAAKQAGISKPIHCHTMRHAFATALLDGGANVMEVCELMGHELVGTTELYLHTSVQHIREQHERFHPRAAISGSTATDVKPQMMVTQAARLIGVGRETIRRWIRSGRLPGYRRGSTSASRYRVFAEAIHAEVKRKATTKAR